MRVNFIVKGVLAAATLCVVPAALLASPKAGQSNVRTAAMQRGVVPNNTASLLDQVQQEAIHVGNQADQLRMMARNPLISWQDEGGLLNRIRAHVNKMNKLVFDLRSREAQDSPMQRHIIERLAMPSYELAGATQDAIVTLNNHQEDVYMSGLGGLANDIYADASRADHTVADQHLNTRREEHQLKQMPGTKRNS